MKQPWPYYSDFSFAFVQVALRDEISGGWRARERERMRRKKEKEA